MRCDLLKVSISCLSLLVASFGNGCSQSQFQPEAPTPTVPPPTPAALSISISPQSLVMKHGDNWEFAAAVTNSSNLAVSWSIQEGSTGGKVSDTGVYTAPTVVGVYHVIATSKTDLSKSATATVSVGTTGFTPTGSLALARFSHTTTLLKNGRVYVAGGAVDSTTLDDGVTVLDQAELYDPAVGTFQLAGKLARAGHTATLLLNGDVLFAGGIADETQDSLIVSANAYLLKEGSGTLQPTGSMSIARYAHSATLLQDGKVLMAGGSSSESLTQTAELYDPESGTFTRVGDMGVPRAPLATLLPSGKVLLTGVSVADAELFDPVARNFRSAGSTSSKWVRAATLLADGRVLISEVTDSDFSAPNPAELYDPGTGKFTLTGTMATRRFGYSATPLPDGTVLVAGGSVFVPGPTPGSAIPTPVATTEIYSPATGAFSPGPTMRRPRDGHTATLMPDGSVLFVGGTGYCCGLNRAIPSAEVYQ